MQESIWMFYNSRTYSIARGNSYLSNLKNLHVCSSGSSYSVALYLVVPVEQPRPPCFMHGWNIFCGHSASVVLKMPVKLSEFASARRRGAARVLWGALWRKYLDPPSQAASDKVMACSASLGKINYYQSGTGMPSSTNFKFKCQVVVTCKSPRSDSESTLDIVQMNIQNIKFF